VTAGKFPSLPEEPAVSNVTVTRFRNHALNTIKVDVELRFLDDSGTYQYRVAADLITKKHPAQNGSRRYRGSYRNAAEDQLRDQVLLADTDVYEQRCDGLPSVLRDLSDDSANEKQNRER
jgi:hypothetical protein